MLAHVSNRWLLTYPRWVVPHPKLRIGSNRQEGKGTPSICHGRFYYSHIAPRCDLKVRAVPNIIVNYETLISANRVQVLSTSYEELKA